MEEENHEQSKSFKELGLCDALVEACTALRWIAPTKIQSDSIPHALQGKDIIGLAETGSGKTGAFALPIIQALLEANTATPFFGLVLAPTRELAIQIAEQFEALGSGISLRTAVLVEGVDMYQQLLALAKRPHIVVATPGRLVDHLTNTKGFSLRTLKYLVLDEADKLLNDEFENSLDDILKVIPVERQTYLFSATMTKKVKKLQRACLRNPVEIELASKYSTAGTLRQEFCFIPAKYKDCYLLYVLMELSGRSMVFTRTGDTAQVVALMLRNLGLRAVPINGKMTRVFFNSILNLLFSFVYAILVAWPFHQCPFFSVNIKPEWKFYTPLILNPFCFSLIWQAKRLGAVNKFKAGECNFLIATDVASRGLDIPSVDIVINYDIPSNSKDYIHRVGRTARAGGVSISLVDQNEIEWFIQIENLIGKKLPKHPAKEEKVLVLLERVTEAKRIAHMEIKESIMARL